ncbi:MAG: YdeI/OmpD-associated family protein [Actinomycetota bacterium]
MQQPTVAFETTVAGSGGKTGIVIPDEVISDLGAGSRPAVHVDLNGYGYRSTVAVMGGTHMVGVNAAVREATGLAAGDAVRVTLTVATSPREVDVPSDFAAALASNPAAETFFSTLSNSLQRYHIDNVNGAKTPETRRRRIDRALALFRDGKQR